MTGVVSLLFVLATFYRSASLYHPQRRAILHLKSQKRKIKSKDKKEKKDSSSNNTEDTSTPPLVDLTTLKSRTVQLLLLSVGVGSFGLNSPIFYLVSLLILLRICILDSIRQQRFSKITFTFRSISFINLILSIIRES